MRASKDLRATKRSIVLNFEYADFGDHPNKNIGQDRLGPKKYWIPDHGKKKIQIESESEIHTQNAESESYD